MTRGGAGALGVRTAGVRPKKTECLMFQTEEGDALEWEHSPASGHDCPFSDSRLNSAAEKAG